jgi:iron complex outermembrane receptor protein
LATLVLLMVPAALLAQGAALNGRVVDAQGAVVTNAQVTASAPGQAERTARTGADGAFSFPGLEPGNYTLRVEAEGFSPATETAAIGNSARSVTIALKVAGLSENITVQGAIIGTAATGKTTLPIRELPLTVNSVPQGLLEEQGARDLVTALRNVPNVNAFTTYGVYEYYAFRGFLDSVQLLDGMRNEGNRVNTQLTNIDRIEVLKGPSSALYGGAALGATVNLIRKKPSPVRAYDFVASAGSWQKGYGGMGATGRAGSNALYRLDLGGNSSEGYRHNDVTRFTLTPSLAWHPGNNQVNVYYTFNRDRFAGDAGLPLVDSDFAVPVEDNVLDVPRDRNYRTPQDFAKSYDNNVQVAYARQLTGSLGFRNTLAYRHFNDEYFLSEEIYFVPPTTIDRYYLYFKHHRRPLTNIAEVTGHFTRGVEQSMVFGWEGQHYFNHTDLPEEDYFQAASIDAFNPIDTQGPSDLTIARSNHFTNNTNAFYVQDHVTLSPQVKLLLGGRYDVYRRQSHSELVDGTETSAIARRDAEAFTGRVGAVYQPIPRVDLYGSWANSFKPLTLAQPDGSSLDPETGSQFEFGQRFHLLANRAELNTAVYRIKRQNVAFRRAGNVYEQAGEVESKGFEADLTTSLSANWRLSASYGFNDAQFLDYEESAGTNLRGNSPVFAPRHTFNFWAGYEWANGFGVNAGTRYMGRTFADNANVFEVDGYATLSLAARYRRGSFEYALNLNNVTDTDYFVPHLDFPQVYPGDPINVLGTVTVRLR